MELEKIYNSKLVEDKIYALWEKSEFFNPDKLPPPSSRKAELRRATKTFTILMPPPNANGALHIGHAVFVTLQDIMIRYKRMRGYKTLWLPGADHAGFETQVVYNKKLERENRQFWQIPKPQLYQEILEFTLANKKHMESQLKLLGASCDWSREKFTLDPAIKTIVYETFKRLYNDGLAYRDQRLVNWCIKHQTTLSDLEIKWIERVDNLYTITYGPLSVATVRPETMFGDVAVAVHPNGKWKNLIGKNATIPIINKKIPIVADETVDESFGTGAVKVTPSIDFNDFEIAKKKGLPSIEIVDRFGKLTNAAPENYRGKNVEEARKVIENDLRQIQALEEIKNDYKHAVAVCYKCERTLEPRLLPQWYIATTRKPKSGRTSLRDMAVAAVKTGKVKFVTKKFEKVFMRWMENLRDWNISRQIVWGIQIPAWYCGNNTFTFKKMGFANDVVAQVLKGKTKTYRLRNHGFRVGDKVLFENSETKTLFGYGIITRIEETTVDKINYRDQTHYKAYHNLRELLQAFKLRNPEKKFSSRSPAYVYAYEFHSFDENDAKEGCGQIIISDEKPMGCPACKGKNLKKDPDVFDTWFSSGQWPFAAFSPKDLKTFYPTQVMETGYDILFFWVARMVMLSLYRTKKIPFETVYLHGLVRDKDRQKMSKSRGNVIDPLGVARIYGTDALRIALTIGNMPGQDIVISEDKIRGYRNFVNKLWNVARFILLNSKDFKPAKRTALSSKDQKILRDFGVIAKKITKFLDSFQFSHAGEVLYRYLWHTFADKVLEQSKPVLQNSKNRLARQHVLLRVLADTLKMLHPFLPFVTEEIYQKLPLKNKKETIMVEQWPS